MLIGLLNKHKLFLSRFKQFKELILLIVMHCIVDNFSKFPKEMKNENWHKVLENWEDGSSETTKFGQNVNDGVEMHIVNSLCIVKVYVRLNC